MELNNENKQSHKAIVCPRCKSERIEFISHYYKRIGARIAQDLFIIALVVLLVIFCFSYENGPYYEFLGWGIVCFSIVIMLHVGILVSESHMHAKAICRDCGYIWLLD
ncbi:MAG TPA: hypothetical protein H9812_05710 [Candidatus Gallimonas intestinigallinarum]|uniref:Uncharacterized protein n=1 Tax=Candidatus Gallimonas intestinigallinarum TaxID=2838604 RepID=A0A9D2IWF3_9FIRM|nr:hypothetical protein [Candidatus Gallimonas intestinigallinarum]